MQLKPLLCSACDEHLGYIDECDNQSDFYCNDCAATFTKLEPVAMDALTNHVDELMGLRYCAYCLAPITAEGWTCLDSCPRKRRDPITMTVTARICT